MAHSYDTYIGWTVVFPLLICSLGLFVNFVVLPLLYYCFLEGDASGHLIHLFYIYSKVIFRDALKREGKDSQCKISLHDYEIPSGHQIILFSTISTMALCSVFISFWASFLVDQTAVCDPMLDCFVTNSSSLESDDPSPPERIQNCADVESNAAVDCFEFVFAVSEGFASAIGFLAVVVAYVYLIGYSLIWLMGLFFSSDHNTSPCARKCTLFAWICLIILPFILVIVIFIVVLSVPLFSDVAFKTAENTLKCFAYLLCFSYVGPFTSLYLSISIIRAHKRSSTCTTISDFVCQNLYHMLCYMHYDSLS